MYLILANLSLVAHGVHMQNSLLSGSIAADFVLCAGSPFGSLHGSPWAWDDIFVLFFCFSLLSPMLSNHFSNLTYDCILIRI